MDDVLVGDKLYTPQKFRERFFIFERPIAVNPVCKECGEPAFFRNGPQSKQDAIEKAKSVTFIDQDQDHFVHNKPKPGELKILCSKRSDYSKSIFYSILPESRANEEARKKKGETVREYFFENHLWKSFVFLKNRIGNKNNDKLTNDFSQDNFVRLIKFADNLKLWERENATTSNIILLLTTTKPFLEISGGKSKRLKYNIVNNFYVLNVVDDDLNPIEEIKRGIFNKKTFAAESNSTAILIDEIEEECPENFYKEIDSLLKEKPKPLSSEEKNKIGIAMAEALQSKTIELLMYGQDADGKLFIRGYDDEVFQISAKNLIDIAQTKIDGMRNGERHPNPGKGPK